MVHAAAPGKVRLSAGSLKGRALAVASDGVRPTPSKIRQALINILGQHLAGTSFLDLYAGTGAVGLEAFSHGAAPVVLVEGEPGQAGLLRRALSGLNLAGSDAIALVALSVERALPLLARAPQRFDVVFIDPPYENWRTPAWCDTMASVAGLVADGGQVIVQRPSRGEPAMIAGLVVRQCRRYGSNAIDFYDRDRGA